jgi:hypothetical protein
VVDRIDDRLRPDDLTELGTGLDGHGLVPIKGPTVCDVVVLAVVILRRQIYPEGATEGDVDKLGAPADGQGWYSLILRGASERQFPVVALSSTPRVIGVSVYSRWP